MSKDKEAIKWDILDKFRSINASAGYILPPNWLESDYFHSLNPKEKKIYPEAVNELISEGKVENVDEVPQNLRLTEKGENLIY